MVSGEKKEVEGILVIKEKKTPRTKKKTRKKRSSPSSKKIGISSAKRETLLIENFIGLQKAMINLSIKFENLSDNISKLLNVFEVSARDYMINKGRTTPEVDKELILRINALLDQNKSIMGGMRNIEEKIKRQDIARQDSARQPISPQSTPLPQPQTVPVNTQQSTQQSSQYIQSKPRTIVQTI